MAADYALTEEYYPVDYWPVYWPAYGVDATPTLAFYTARLKANATPSMRLEANAAPRARLKANATPSKELENG